MPDIISALWNGAGSWGVTEEEKRLPFGVDALGAQGGTAYFRGVTINAPAAIIYRWLLQLKVSPYSYDLLDNLGRQSPRRLTAGLENLEIGQTFMFIFELAGFEKDQSLTLRVKSPLTLGGLLGSSALSYDIFESGGGASRLLVKIVIKYPWGPFGWPGKIISPPGDLVMMRKQLFTIKELAEAQARESASKPA